MPSARAEHPVSAISAVETTYEEEAAALELAPQPIPIAVADLVGPDDDQIDADAAQLVGELVAEVRCVPHRAEAVELRRGEPRGAVGHGAVMHRGPQHRRVLAFSLVERHLDDADVQRGEPAVNRRDLRAHQEPADRRGVQLDDEQHGCRRGHPSPVRQRQSDQHRDPHVRDVCPSRRHTHCREARDPGVEETMKKGVEAERAEEADGDPQECKPKRSAGVSPALARRLVRR